MANIGNARAWRSVFIQGPGRGILRASAGDRLAAKNGSAMPVPMAANTSRACQLGKPSAKPSEAPMKGAVQGEATATASRPESAELSAGWRASSVLIRLGRNWPNSNRPARFKPSSVKSSASAATTAGDCS